MRMIVITLLAMSYCTHVYAMNFFKSEKNKVFSITTQDGKTIPVCYDYAVQIKALHPLQEKKSVQSRHAESDISFFLGALKAIQCNEMGAYLNLASACPEKIKTVDFRVQENGSIAFENLLTHFCGDEGVKRKGNLHTMMNVAQELEATEFCMLCIPECFNVSDQHTIFSRLIPSQCATKFEAAINKYIVEKVGRSIKSQLDAQDALLIKNKPSQTLVVSPCQTKVARIEQNGNIGIYDINDVLLKSLNKQTKRYTSSVAFSGDGKKIACVERSTNSYNSGETSRLCMWDVETGRLQTDCILRETVVNIALNNDGTMAVANISFVTPKGGYWLFHNLVIDLATDKPQLLYDISSGTKAQELYLRTDNKVVYYSDPVKHGHANSQLDLNVGKEMISTLNFAQLVLLYQLYELSTSKKSLLPVMTGFVRDYVHGSLPEILRSWSTSRLREIHDHIK